MAPGARQRTRAGPRKGDVYRIGGVDIPYDPEMEMDKAKPTPIYPPYKPQPPKPLTTDEKRSVTHFRSLRDSIHEGPLYTVPGNSARITKPGTVINPFEGMPKYSQRYKKKKRVIPKLDGRPYVLSFFPKELHSTLDPAAAANGTVSKSKSLQIPGYQKAEDLGLFDHEVSEGEEGDGAGKRAEDDDDPLGGGEDDEYEDDEEGGDYNAEQYFDDGGDDGGEDYDAGGDGGGEFWS